MLNWATFAALLLPVVSAQSASDETSQSTGLLGLASLLPTARYGTPHLSQLVGPRFSFVNPFVNGWFIGAYNGIMQGKPIDTQWGVITASVSGADIDVTNPFLQDILSSFVDETQNGGPQEEGLSWSIAVINASRFKLPQYARAFTLVMTAVLLAVPIVTSVLLGDYSGMGSVIYVAFGVAMRAVENLTHVSVAPRKGAFGNKLGLIRASGTGIVVLHSNDKDAPNIEDLIHPRMKVRNEKCAGLYTFLYRSLAGLLLAGWLGFLVAAPEKFTNGYIELATMAISALSEVLMHKLVIGSVKFKIVRKCNAITSVAWLAHRQYLDTAGVPRSLLNLRQNEKDLVHALYKNQVTEAQWRDIKKCNRAQALSDMDGPPTDCTPTYSPADLA